MIEARYFPKRIVATPDWLQAPAVRTICSVSECISPGPAGWIDDWLHNEFGWFNQRSDALTVIPTGAAHDYRLFAFRLYPEVFREGNRIPLVVGDDVHPEPVAGNFRTLGFDSANKSMESVLGLECSPLSCSSMAIEMPTNEHCFFPTLDAALLGAELFSREQPEPGDYYVVEVLEGPLDAG